MSAYFCERGDKASLEEGLKLCPKFDENGLIPAITVDHKTNEILMFAFMNAESLAKSLEIGEVVYYSRSRKRQWHKGEESGNVQRIREVRTDCDQDVLLFKVEQVGEAACHTGRRSCFYRNVPFGDALAKSDNGLDLSFTPDSQRVFDPAKVYKKK